MLCEASAQIVEGSTTQCLSTLRIGDVALGISCATPEQLALDSHLLEFSCERGNLDIQMSVQWCKRLRPQTTTPAFDSGAAWKLFRDGNGFVFDFTSAALDAKPYKRMYVDADFRSISMMLNHELLSQEATVYPLEYPADELLFTNYLALQGLGVEVHGCGLIDSQVGACLFLGHSGAGKSTTARLWHSMRGAEIFSDDRIILRLHDGQLWMYGTPWHGDGEFASAKKARLERIFILRHGTENRFSEISNAYAVGELFARCFPPFHNAKALERTVEFLNSVARTVPCYDFQFTPDARALESMVGFRNS